MTLDDELRRWDVLSDEALAAVEDDDGFAEFEAFWPIMDDLPDGADIFAEQYGPPTGKESPAG